MIKTAVVVDLPKPPHKIYLVPSNSGIYVQVDSKNYTLVDKSERVNIGMLCSDNNTKMHPTDSYYEIFEPENAAAMRQAAMDLAQATSPAEPSEDESVEPVQLLAATNQKNAQAQLQAQPQLQALVQPAFPLSHNQSHSLSHADSEQLQPASIQPQIVSASLQSASEEDQQDDPHSPLPTASEQEQQDAPNSPLPTASEQEPQDAPNSPLPTASVQDQQDDPNSPLPTASVQEPQDAPHSPLPTESVQEPQDAAQLDMITLGKPHLDKAVSDHESESRAASNDDSQDQAQLEAKDTAKHHSSVISVGPYMAIKRGADAIMMSAMLNKCIALSAPTSNISAEQILDLAAYSLLNHPRSPKSFQDYLFNHYMFETTQRIPSEDETANLLSELNEKMQQSFFDVWNKNFVNCDEVMIRFDSSNRHSKLGRIELSEIGTSADSNLYPSLNIAIAYTLRNSIPLLYKNDCASLSDSTALKEFIDKLHSYGYKKVTIDLSSDSFSDEAYEIFNDADINFMMHLSGDNPLLSNLISNYKDILSTDPSYSLDAKIKLSAKTIKHEFHGKKRYFHLFFSQNKCRIDTKNLDLKLKSETELLNTPETLDIEKDCHEILEHFNITYADDGKTVLSATQNNEAIAKKYNACGFFCIVSSKKIKADAAYSTYKSLALSDKFFANHKTYPIAKRSEMNTQSSLHGIVFILFISLILRVKLHAAIKDKRVKASYLQNSVQLAMNELMSVELFQPLAQHPYTLVNNISVKCITQLSRFGISKDMADDMIALFCSNENLYKGPSAPREDCTNDLDNLASLSLDQRDLLLQNLSDMEHKLEQSAQEKDGKYTLKAQVNSEGSLLKEQVLSDGGMHPEQVQDEKLLLRERAKADRLMLLELVRDKRKKVLDLLQAERRKDEDLKDKRIVRPKRYYYYYDDANDDANPDFFSSEEELFSFLE